MNNYSRCTSLGSDCQVGWQIRQTFDNPIPSPFDWLVTPLVSLEAILEDRGSRFSKSVTVLPAAPPYAKESTLCDEYGCSYHHEFEHDADGAVVITDEALKTSRAKLLHKWQSFEEIVGKQDEVLFVHLGSFKSPPIAWPYLRESEPLKISRINQLQARLAHLFPKTRCRLLQVYYPEFSPMLDDEPYGNFVDVRTLPYEPALNWEGDRMVWAEVLGAYDHLDRKRSLIAHA